MTRARTLADMISDGVIGTTELADDAITPVKLDETGNYQVAQLEISGSSSLHDALRLTSTSSANGAGAILSYEIDGADRASMRGYIDGSTLGGNLISFTSDSSGNLQERTRITSDGHFGVASSVNANWESVRDVIQLRHGALSTNNDTQFAMSANHYYDGSASRFARAGQATMYQQLYGRHEFYLSGSGTQDAAITYSEALRLDTAGAIFNESSLDRDFRVESDNEAFMFFVNAGSDIVGIGAAVPNQAKRLRVYSDSMNSESKFLAEFSDGSNTGNDGGVLISSYLPRLCMNDLTTSSKWFDWKMDTNKLQLGYGSNTDLYTREVGGILEVSTSDAVFNQGGQDRDFRVESGNQTHMLYVDAGSNSVGVKTNATDAALNVNSQSSSTEAIRITGSGGNPFIEMVGNQGQTAIRMWENGANDPGYTTWYNQGSEQHKIQSGANETVVFNEQGINTDFRVESANNANMLFVDASQDRIGIGTSGPESTLCVNGDILAPWGNSGSVQIGIATRGSNIYNTGRKDLIIKGAGAAAGAQAMQGGDVYVQGGVGAGNEGLNIYAGHLYLEGGNHTGGVGVESGAGKIFMKTAGYERLNINQYGGVTINEAGRNCDFRVESDNNTHMMFMDASTDQLFLRGSSDNFTALAGGAVHLNTTSGWNGFKTEVVSANYVAYASKGSGTNAHYFAYMANGSNQAVGHIFCNTTSTTYSTSSDYRLKENVVELTGATERLKQLHPKRFNFIATPDITVDGFLAHEAQEVVPEAVTGTHNEVREDGTPEYQGIDQSKLVPLLVATIKELEARITALENA